MKDRGVMLFSQNAEKMKEVSGVTTDPLKLKKFVLKMRKNFKDSFDLFDHAHRKSTVLSKEKLLD